MPEALLSGDALRPCSNDGFPVEESPAVSRSFAVLRSDDRIRFACAAVGWGRAKIGKLQHLRDAPGWAARCRPSLARLSQSMEERQSADAPIPPTDTPQGGWKPPLLGTGHARQLQFDTLFCCALDFGQFRPTFGRQQPPKERRFSTALGSVRGRDRRVCRLASDCFEIGQTSARGCKPRLHWRHFALRLSGRGAPCVDDVYSFCSRNTLPDFFSSAASTSSIAG